MAYMSEEFNPDFVPEMDEAVGGDSLNRDRIMDAAGEQTPRPVDTRVRTEASEQTERPEGDTLPPLRPRRVRAVDDTVQAPHEAPAGGGGFGGGLGGTGTGTPEAGVVPSPIRTFDGEPAVTLTPDREPLSIARHFRRVEPTLDASIEIELPEEAGGTVREKPTRDQMRVVGEFHPVAKQSAEAAPKMDEKLIEDGPANLLDAIARFLNRLFG